MVPASSFCFCENSEILQSGCHTHVVILLFYCIGYALANNGDFSTFSKSCQIPFHYHGFCKRRVLGIKFRSFGFNSKNLPRTTSAVSVLFLLDAFVMKFSPTIHFTFQLLLNCSMIKAETKVSMPSVMFDAYMHGLLWGQRTPQ